MKHFFLTILFAVVAMAVQGQIHYRFEGDLGDASITQPFYLINQNNFEMTVVDTIQVKNGKIIPHDAVADSMFIAIMISADNTIQYQPLVESGTIVAGYNQEIEEVFFTGTPLNDESTRVYIEVIKLDELNLSKGELTAKIDSIVFPVLQKHADDPLGLQLECDFASEVGSYQRGIEYIDELAKKWRDLTVIQNERRRFETQLTTQIGTMFKDFAVEYDGKTTRLSDYVGRGQYVLVDFWASWCGACRMEIPNLNAAYEKYHSKGLQVVGIAVWDKPEATLKAISKDNPLYPQIINAQSIATDLYGINAIPEIMLFAPDGTILARWLHGASIRMKLEEIFGEGK